MNFLDIFLIGIALAMDAFAVTIANCTVYQGKLNKKHAVSMPITFALFQFIMPVIGCFVGDRALSFLAPYSKWITAAIFFILALKIVFDKLLKKNEDKKTSSFNFVVLLVQGIATSIDALILGVTFALSLTINIFLCSAIIGAVTFIIVFIALFIGKFLGEKLKNYAGWIGAVILLFLAVKSIIGF